MRISNITVFILKINNSTHYYNNWNFTYMILNTIVICSLSSAVIVSTSDIEIKEVNATESYFKNLKIIWIKQDLGHTGLQGLNQHVKEENTISKMITVSSLQYNNINQQSSITKQTNDSLYNVELGWDPTDLLAGRNTIFMIKFLNHKTNLEEKEIDYSFKVMYPVANLTIKDAKHQKAPIGTGIQIVKFPIPGQVYISINLTIQQPHRTENKDNITSSSENVNFYLKIPPIDVSNNYSLNSRI
jgi:hypothetical protein